MVRFRRCLILAGALCAAAVSGCAVWSGVQRVTVSLNYPHASGESLSQSGQDHYHAVSQVSAHDARALVDDFDLLFLSERPTRLTRWHVR